MKIRAGDTVVITAGKDKGKTGTVLKTLVNKNRVVVGDVNMRTKHVRSYPNRPGQIVKYEASIDASNVMVVDAKTKKRVRIGSKKDDKGRKVRYAKQTGDVIAAGKVPTTQKEKREAATSASKDKAPTSESKAPKKTESEASAAEKKGPFWKKMGFGAEEAADAGNTKGDAQKSDHSVPETGTTPDKSHSSRGK